MAVPKSKPVPPPSQREPAAGTQIRPAKKIAYVDISTEEEEEEEEEEEPRASRKRRYREMDDEGKFYSSLVIY